MRGAVPSLTHNSYWRAYFFLTLDKMVKKIYWGDQVNYTVKKSWKALHFTTRILKKGNRNTKSLAYTSLVHLILEYGAVCWDPYRIGQIDALD
jgi:hypothetical protein